jgi:peroxiredoxin
MPNYHQYASAFDYSELTTELEIPFKKRQTVKPLKTGNHVYDLILKKENINRKHAFKGGETQSSVVLRRLAGKPLVISFYTSQWQEYGLNHLKQLNLLQKEIEALGANILIITPDAMDKALEEIIWNNSLYLNFYYDQDNQVAKKLKVYADHDPAWNRYPGIEVNIPLLATYILDATNHIIFDHVDETLEEGIPSQRLLDGLHANSLYALKSKSA